ncbi:MAG: hypothetical protein JNL84_13080 [Candidatus Accumulibacter sp.]|nr:hypothetical protein [Accumulibacter sp.]
MSSKIDAKFSNPYKLMGYDPSHANTARRVAKTGALRPLTGAFAQDGSATRPTRRTQRLTVNFRRLPAKPGRLAADPQRTLERNAGDLTTLTRTASPRWTEVYTTDSNGQ